MKSDDVAIVILVLAAIAYAAWNAYLTHKREMNS
jgi:Tfp pilus assembly protein PilE